MSPVSLEVAMRSLRYADKVAVITGGSSGIGRGCALEFVKAGARVVICGNNEAEGMATATTLQQIAREQQAGDAHFIYCDVRKTEDLNHLIDATVARHARI